MNWVFFFFFKDRRNRNRTLRCFRVRIEDEGMKSVVRSHPTM